MLSYKPLHRATYMTNQNQKLLNPIAKQKFNSEHHHAVLRHISAAQKLFPEEKNISTLLKKYFEPHNITPPRFSNTGTRRPPTVQDSMTEKGHLIQCPQCKAFTLKLFALCHSCKESERGAYKTKLQCDACGYTQRSPKNVIEWLTIFRVDFNSQSKKSLGIKTVTDDGVK